MSLDDAGAHLTAPGVAFEREHERIWLDDAEGNRIELMPFREADDRRPDIARSTTVLPGFRPANSATSTS